MTDILKKICLDKSKEIEILKNKCSLNTLKKLVSDKIEKRDFKNTAIESVIDKNNLIIGEIKKSSPSAGQIIKEYHPEEIAKTYESAGIGAVSILTEKNYFNGEIDHLSLIKQNTRIPILRKDFIIDEYQIFESNCAGCCATWRLAGLSFRRAVHCLIRTDKMRAHKNVSAAIGERFRRTDCGAQFLGPTSPAKKIH